MRRVLFLLLGLPLAAADLPADKGTEIPASGKRPVVVSGKAVLPLPKHDLPPGYTLELAAASPLVTHPIMGCLDDRGRLFVGDAVGVNWNKKQLEENPPNRVLMLEDTDHDGAFDKSTVFADKMTFPQGACWLNGSLYVCSPPGLWKLTDTNNDGIADEREMIVGGFEYTGNAADVHGPFLHPNGRLYWCHGRKGHKVVQKDGTPVDESMACGIWSCRPDGSDVAWHSLGCGDNPVEVDFTAEGDIIGVQNLYYSQPRGDTLVHWLYGGVYERADQLKAIAHLPRTLETMPVMYNFGHVAVSGCAFWRGWPSAKDAQQFMVTHFNTQRLVRMELTPDGSTYKAVENEFLKMHNPDIHLTDVMEDADGSLLLLDTGGWFRIGCPASLMAKADMLGAVYRIRPPVVPAREPGTEVSLSESGSSMEGLKSGDAHLQRHACEAIARAGKSEHAMDVELDRLLSQDIDSALEHSVIHALVSAHRSDGEKWLRGALMKHSSSKRSTPEFIARWGKVGSQLFLARTIFVAEACGLRSRLFMEVIKQACWSHSTEVKDAVLFVGERWPEAARLLASSFASGQGKLSPQQMAKWEHIVSGVLDEPGVRASIIQMFEQQDRQGQVSALRVLASKKVEIGEDAWFPAAGRLLADDATPEVFDALKRLRSPYFDPALKAIASDTKRPLAVRLKALDSAASVKLDDIALAMVKGVLVDPAASSAAKIQAAGMMAAAPLKGDQVLEVAPLFATLGPVEMKTLLPLVRKHKDVEVARRLATEIAKNPVIASQQESAYRTAFSDLPPEIFEGVILPAYNAAVAATEAKKRQLSPLAEKVIANGSAANGEKHFKAGKGTCVACHKIGDTGRPIGPDLSHIGAIRTERDLLESILFPSNTLARDYEAHVIETSDGQQTLGVIKSHAAEGLVVLDIAGQEKTIAHQSIVGDTTLTTSLMPMGLDQTMPEAELLDLVAWLRSLK